MVAEDSISVFLCLCSKNFYSLSFFPCPGLIISTQDWYFFCIDSKTIWLAIDHIYILKIVIRKEKHSAVFESQEKCSAVFLPSWRHIRGKFISWPPRQMKGWSVWHRSQPVLLVFVGTDGRQGQGLIFMRENFEQLQVHKCIITRINLEGWCCPTSVSKRTQL